MSRSLSACSVLLVALLCLAGCGTDEPAATAEPTAQSSPSPSDPPTSSPTATVSPSASKPAGTVIDIRIAGDDISPEAKELRVRPGEKITLRFDTDRAGELHVHSSPARYVEFRRGTSEHTLTLRQPGVVDIEEHDSGQLVARLQVR